MYYNFIKEHIAYEYKLPDMYVLSNLELTLQLKNGQPYKLLSSKSGFLLSFLSTNLPEPEKAHFWPDGCEFTSKQICWRFLTSAHIRSILWHMNGIERLIMHFRVPLEKQFKVPFSGIFNFAQPMEITTQDSKIDFSNLISIEVLSGKIAEFQMENDRNFQLKISCDEQKNIKIRFSTRYELVDEEKENFVYNEFLKKSFSKVQDDLIRSLAVFALHTAMSSWKDLGLRYALAAGVNYSFPPRTYFRDSFWTCLSLLDVEPRLVREQILVLSESVHDDGCPSAVMFLNDEEKVLLRELVQKDQKIRENTRYENDWWSDHHDSGFLYVLLLSKYLQSTGDLSILNQKVNGDTVLGKAAKVLRNADKFVQNGLYRKPFDCKDWTDNVFRNGFVTYDAALHTAALREASKLFKMVKRKESELFEERYLLSKKKLNELLFDKKKGYFVDFVGTYVEDHLNIDTIVAILFDVADEKNVVSTLKNMQQLLETQNNRLQPYGDWGVMSVWPHYKKRTHLFGKSAFPYRYHNGSCWPYLSCAYAEAKHRFGLDPTYPLLSWWRYSLEKGWVNPVEYYSPPYGRGSLQQAWSSYAAVVVKQIWQ